MPSSEEMLDALSKVQTNHKARMAAERAALKNAEHDLSNPDDVVTEYACAALKRNILKRVRGALGLPNKGVIWFAGQRVSLDVRPDFVDRPDGVRAWCVQICIMRQKLGKQMQVNCLKSEALSCGLWAFCHMTSQMRLSSCPAILPPVPMAKQLAEKGLACSYVWTLAAAAACAVEGV